MKTPQIEGSSHFFEGTTPPVEWHLCSGGADGQGSTCPDVIVPPRKPEPWKCWLTNKERIGEWSPVFGKGRHWLSFRGFAKGRGKGEEIWTRPLSDQAFKHRKFQSNLNNTARIKADKQNQEEIEEGEGGEVRFPRASGECEDRWQEVQICRKAAGRDNSLQGSRKARRHETLQITDGFLINSRPRPPPAPGCGCGCACRSQRRVLCWIRWCWSC